MNWMTPTTYMQRLGDAMALLCGGHRPPDEILGAWLNECDDDNRLQEFACEHGPIWSQGIVLIDAAILLASQPGEGVDHEITPNTNVTGLPSAQTVKQPPKPAGGRSELT